MRNLSYLLVISMILTACGQGFQSSGLLPEDLPVQIKTRDYGKGPDVKGSAYRAERPSEARPRLEKDQANGVDLSEVSVLFDEDSKVLKSSLLYTKRVNGRSLQKRLLLQGTFTDFKHPVIIRSSLATKGDIVRGYAFCKPTASNQADKCEYLVIDYYFVGLDGKLDKVQLEKKISAEIILDAIAEEPNKDSANTDAASAEPVETTSDDGDIEFVEEHEEIEVHRGDVQTTKPREKEFYTDWVIPAVQEEEKPATQVVPAPAPAAPAQKEPVVEEPPAVKETPVQVETSKAGKIDLKPIQITVGQKAPRASMTSPESSPNIAYENLAADDEIIAPVVDNEDDVSGERVSFDPDFESFEKEEERVATLFNLIGISSDEDSHQAIGHYAGGRLANGVKLGNNGEYAGIRRGRDNEPVSYGTGLMIKLLIYFGDWSQKNLGIPFQVNQISKNGGGLILNSRGKPAHKSHQIGLDADIIYLGRTGGPEGSINIAKNWNLLKAIYDTGLVSSVFVNVRRKNEFCEYARKNNLISGNEDFTKRLHVQSGHIGHFHLRLKCTSLNPRCVNDADFPTMRACN